jgi:hypothetical protein
LIVAAAGAAIGCSDDAPLAPAPVAAPLVPAPPAPEGASAVEAYAERLRTLAEEDPVAAARAMQGSSMSRRDAVARMTTQAETLYGGFLPIYLSYTSSSDEAPALLTQAGCQGEIFTAPDLRAKNVREFLTACPPHGPNLLSYVAPDEHASVGMATLALIAESRASPEVRTGALHRSLMAGLLSNGPPIAPAP